MRTEKGLPPLIQDTSLCALAYIRAYEAYSHLSHSRPNGDSYTSVFTDYGYGYTVSQEVYARTDLITTTEEILWIWLEGTSTSSKLTDPELSHAGIGIYKKNSYVIVVCLLTAK